MVFCYMNLTVFLVKLQVYPLAEQGKLYYLSGGH